MTGDLYIPLPDLGEPREEDSERTAELQCVRKMA